MRGGPLRRRVQELLHLRDLRRLESVSLSPAFAGFDELLRGLAHVRAFGMELRYQDRFYKRVDKFQSFDHVYVSCPLNLSGFSVLKSHMITVARRKLARVEVRL